MSLLAILVLVVGVAYGAYWRGRRIESEIWCRHWPVFPYDKRGKEIEVER